jgi:hypothetical protein
MPSITTLVPDIYAYLDRGDDTSPLATPNTVDPYRKQVNHSAREAPTVNDPLYASEYGDACARRVWYKRNTPEKGEPLQPYVRMKFMYGDAVEELLLSLATCAGHRVTHQQERCVLGNSAGKELLTGRMDAIIDGHVVDAKSMSTYAYNKYKNDGILRESNDTFGYRWQLAFYHWYAVEQMWVAPDTEPYILALDKTLGHMMLVPVELPDQNDVICHAARMLGSIEQKDAPDRAYVDVAEGKAGNRKLDIACSYCSFKHECWPGLRTFLYSRGPAFLTHVAETPRVTELK